MAEKRESKKINKQSTDTKSAKKPISEEELKMPVAKEEQKAVSAKKDQQLPSTFLNNEIDTSDGGKTIEKRKELVKKVPIKTKVKADIPSNENKEEPLTRKKKVNKEQTQGKRDVSEPGKGNGDKGQTHRMTASLRFDEKEEGPKERINKKQSGGADKLGKSKALKGKPKPPKRKSNTKFIKEIISDETTRAEISQIVGEILPNKQEIDKSIGNLKKQFSPEIEIFNKIKEQIIPEKKLKKNVEKVKEAVKNIKTLTQDKAAKKNYKNFSLITEYDIHLFKEGKHFHLYKKFGAHIIQISEVTGVYFSLWAPNAHKVSVIGDFNGWDKTVHPMISRTDDSGIWEIFIPEVNQGSLYKYSIKSTSGYEVEKGDPFAFRWETPPNTASVVWDLENNWNDTDWLTRRKKLAKTPKPVSVYEVHLGSWKRVPEDGMRSLSYRELAKELPVYIKQMGFTHVEFMPVMEHPFFGSWGYQITGYFAPSSRFGSPQDFMYLIDTLHEAEIGIILDWVPSHFPSDQHGLHYFDGTFLYEHEDPRKGFHPDWQSYIFNYGRKEVRSFLISNALFWFDKFHVDGLRVDAVASMLYLDYSRKQGEWEPNSHGGNENLEAISFLKELNEVVYSQFPDVITIAEESTAWPNVSKPTNAGGLGFGMKWMMGWMHDSLDYFMKDPIHRKYHQNTITFSTTYAFTENFMLPLSHDEVVYGKKSIWNKMPGDSWNKFANLRALYAYMFAHPGTKLLFMGGEFAQIEEWDHDSSLDWHLTEVAAHNSIQKTISKLNELYKNEPAFYENSFEHIGFEWVDFNDTENCVISFLRKSNEQQDTILVIGNLTPVPRENYRIGVPEPGNWKEIFNSDDSQFGGSGLKNAPLVHTEKVPLHNKNYSLVLTLPPMSFLYFKKKPISL